MTLELVALGWRYPAETAAERLILLKICDEANSRGQSIYFAMETYARAGLLKSTRGAQKIILRLEEKGIIQDDPDFEASLRKEGTFVKTRVFKLNIEKLKADGDAVKGKKAVIDAFMKKDTEGELSSPSDDASDPELSSPSPEELTPNSVHPDPELSSPDPYLESFSNNPHNPLEQDFKEDFEKLWAAWTPFEMLHGDRPQAERKYAKIRSEGIGSEQVLLAARVYCQQCRNTRCKTKHIENWLGQCMWKPEGKMLGEGSNGKSRDKKPPAANAEKPRALRHQLWHDVVKAQLGDLVYRSWIERLWLEGDILYCPTRFIADFVQQKYGREVIAAVGHDVRYLAELPPQHAFADFVEHPAGGIDDHHEATA